MLSCEKQSVPDTVTHPALLGFIRCVTLYPSLSSIYFTDGSSWRLLEGREMVHKPGVHLVIRCRNVKQWQRKVQQLDKHISTQRPSIATVKHGIFSEVKKKVGCNMHIYEVMSRKCFHVRKIILQWSVPNIVYHCTLLGLIRFVTLDPLPSGIYLTEGSS